MNFSEDFQTVQPCVGLACALNESVDMEAANQTGPMQMLPGAVDSLVSIGTAVLLALVILITAVGNVFVISVILLERHLQSVANYLILSLAVADLLVACLVMPLGAVYEVSQKWLLGPALCDMWTSSDVLCCTASILHLVAIATDRYWAVTSIDYIQQRTVKRILFMIVMVWAISLVISLGPTFGWKDEDWHHRVEVKQQCLVSQDVGYQVFATLATFYLPLAIILFLYWRIFQTAQKRIRRKQTTTLRAVNTISHRSAPQAAISIVSETTMLSCSPPQANNGTDKTCDVEMSTASDLETVNGMASEGPRSGAGSVIRFRRSATTKKRKAETKRERKAAKTLAIITGAFVVCWLPFFVIALLLPICSACHFDDTMMSFFLWLGYFNSTLNPILYTIFSPEFRSAFQKLLRLKTNAKKRLNLNDPERRSIAVSNYSG